MLCAVCYIKINPMAIIISTSITVAKNVKMVMDDVIAITYYDVGVIPLYHNQFECVDS